MPTPSFTTPPLVPRAPMAIDPDAAYDAVLARAPDADFVYAVVTTGVYCRTSCRARRPRRENARFFRTTAEARAAGYRPCKRCRPDAAPADVRVAERIAELCRAIDGRIDDPPTLADLADQAGLSPSHTHRLFKRVTGLTPRGYAQARRAQRFREGLAGAPTVTAAIYEAGFGSSSRCYEKADAMLGMTPSAYRAGAPGKVIRYAIGPCSLGRVLVAATERGICAILLGDGAEELVADLRGRFGAAELAPSAELAAELADVVATVDDPSRPFALPLDVRGTAFQQKVWEALRTIPCGQTTTYSELAAAIGKPKAVRAVASACANNPVAVVVPCHRVRRKDGGLAGYRWGVDRKRMLLDRESDE